MLTKKYVFRPAWLLFVGPGLLLAMLLTAGVILSASSGIISARIALGLHLVPNLVFLASCACWLASGNVVVKPNQVVLQGWAWVHPQHGPSRRVYVQYHVPRSEWHTLQVHGLLLATLTWTGQQETVVLGHLAQAHLLKHLLHTQRRAWASASLTQKLYTRRARGLGLLRAFSMLKIVFHTGIAIVERLYPEAAPGLELAARRCLGRARRLFCALRELPGRLPHRVLRFEDLSHPDLERTWFAHLLQDVETSPLSQCTPARAHARAFVQRMN